LSKIKVNEIETLVSGTNLKVGSTLDFQNASNLINVSGVTISGNVNVGGTLNATNITGGITPTGAITSQGNFNVGSPTSQFNVLAASGNTTVSGTLTTGGAVTFKSTSQLDGNLQIGSGAFTVDATSGDTKIGGTLNVEGSIVNLAAPQVTIGEDLVVNGTATVSGITKLNSTQASTSTTTGSLQVAGGAGIAGALYAGTSLNSASLGVGTSNNRFTVDASGNTNASGTINSASSVSFSGGRFTSDTSGNTIASGTLGVGGNTSLKNTTIDGTLGAGTGGVNFKVDASGNTLVSGTLAVSGTTSLGDVGNLKLGGGSNGQYLKTDGASGLSWSTVTGGSGGGMFSYSADGDLWSSYVNSSPAATPEWNASTTQTSLTLTYSTGSALFSDNDQYLLVKGPGTLLGNGVRSGLYTLQPRHLGRVIQISFDYALTGANAGNYKDGDLTVWISDTANSAVIQPTSYQIMKGGTDTPLRFVGSFQTPVNMTTFRVLIHEAVGTTSSAYNMKISDIKVGEPQYSVGAVITDWQSYTPTFTGLGSVTGIDYVWRRVGGYLEVIGKNINGTCTGSTIGISLPSGLVVQSNGNVYTETVGECHRDLAGSQYTVIVLDGDTTFSIGFMESSTNPFAKITGTFSSLNNMAMRMWAKVRIKGWGSSVAMSSDTGDGRVVAVKYNNTTNGATTSNTQPIFWGTKEYDTHNTVTIGTAGSTYASGNAWKFTTPISGYYRVTTSCALSSSPGGIAVWVNNSQISYLSYGDQSSNGSGTFKLNAGDILDVRSDSTVTSDSGTTRFISIERISAGTQQIAATETVAASYYSAATQSSLTTQINFGTKIFDTHGAVTTGSSWKFTAPMSGKYLVHGKIQGGGGGCHLYKNGSVFYYYISYFNNAGIANYTFSIDLIAGDYIDMRPSSSITLTGGNFSSIDSSVINISRIGL